MWSADAVLGTGADASNEPGERRDAPDLLLNALVSPEALRALGFDLTRIESTFTGAMARATGSAPPTSSAALPGDVEHFGFRDGISQPGVRGRLSARPDHGLTRRYLDPSDPRAATFARPGQPLLWPGQFVFGYATELKDDPVTPGPIAKPPAPRDAERVVRGVLASPAGRRRVPPLHLRARARGVRGPRARGDARRAPGAHRGPVARRHPPRPRARRP